MDHEWTDFGEDLAVKGLPAHAQTAFGIGIDVAESEVDDGTGGIGDAIEDVEVVQSALRGGKESGVVRSGERVRLSMPSR